MLILNIISRSIIKLLILSSAELEVYNLKRFTVIIFLLFAPALAGCNPLNGILERNFSLDSVASFPEDEKKMESVWFYCDRCLKDISCENYDIDQCKNTTIPSRSNALNKAVGRANFKAVYFLIDVTKVDVNGVTGRYKETPLIIAAYYGTREHQKIADYLLSKGADIDAISLNSKTALTTAIWKGNIDFAEFLLKKGANPSATPRGNIEGMACEYALRKKAIRLLPSIPGCCSQISSKLKETGEEVFNCNEK